MTPKNYFYKHQAIHIFSLFLPCILGLITTDLSMTLAATVIEYMGQKHGFALWGAKMLSAWMS